MTSCGIYFTSRSFSRNILFCCGNHTNIINILTFLFVIVKIDFLFFTFAFESIVGNISETNSFHYVIFKCNSSLQWIWLDYLSIFSMEKYFFFSTRWCSVPKTFSYSLENYSILLKKFYLSYPRNYEHLTQEIWGSLIMRDSLSNKHLLVISIHFFCVWHSKSAPIHNLTHTMSISLMPK